MLVSFLADIEAQILEIQGMKAALLEEGDQGVGLDSTGYYDQEIYGGSDSRFAGYVTSIAANEQEDVSVAHCYEADITNILLICPVVRLYADLPGSTAILYGV